MPFSYAFQSEDLKLPDMGTKNRDDEEYRHQLSQPLQGSNQGSPIHLHRCNGTSLSSYRN